MHPSCPCRGQTWLDCLPVLSYLTQWRCWRGGGATVCCPRLQEPLQSFCQCSVAVDDTFINPIAVKEKRHTLQLMHFLWRYMTYSVKFSLCYFVWCKFPSFTVFHGASPMYSNRWKKLQPQFSYLILFHLYLPKTSKTINMTLNQQKW